MDVAQLLVSVEWTEGYWDDDDDEKNTSR